MTNTVLVYGFSFPHHGMYSSYYRLTHFLGPDCKTIGFPNNPNFLFGSRRLQRSWFKLNEYRMFPHYFSPVRRCIHYLYPENTLFSGMRWRGRNGLVLTWHQPFSYFRDLGLEDQMKLKTVIRTCDRIIFLSTESAIEYAEACEFEHYSVILHGVDTSFFRPALSRNNQAAINIITVGDWLRDVKCWAQVVNSMAGRSSVVNFRVLCRSQHERRYREHLCPPHGNIEFVANLSDGELKSFYQTADIAFLPLQDATANNALLECMSSGIPCVVSDLPATREYAGDTALFFDNRDSGQAVDALDTLVRRAELRVFLGKAARSRAESVLSWPITAEKHHAVYQRVLATSPQAVANQSLPPRLN